jgi:hypothetical protein
MAAPMVSPETKRCAICRETGICVIRRCAQPARESARKVCCSMLMNLTNAPTRDGCIRA